MKENAIKPEGNGFSIYHRRGDISYGFVIKKQQKLGKLLKIVSNYQDIQVNYINVFQMTEDSVGERMKYFDYFIESYNPEKENINFSSFLPFINVLYKEEFIFKHVFENQFYRVYLDFQQRKIPGSEVKVQKILFITAHIFLIINIKIIQKLLQDDFFSILKDMVKARFNIEGKEIPERGKFENFSRDKREIFQSLQLGKKDFDFEFMAKLQFLVQYLLKGCLEEKYVQIYVNFISNKQYALLKEIIKEPANVGVIVRNIKKRKFIYWDFLIELLYMFKNSPSNFLKTVKYLNDNGFMEYILERFLKIEFIKYEDFILMQITDLFFKDLRRFDQLLSLFCFYIIKNPKKILAMIFSLDQKRKGFLYLKNLLLIHLQNQFQKFSSITSSIVKLLLNNISSSVVVMYFVNKYGLCNSMVCPQNK